MDNGIEGIIQSMCGITGFLDTKISLGKKEAESIGKAMGDAIKSRGPDSWGLWFKEEAGLLFSHRRLSIQDLSVEGHQPMRSPSGRFMVVYNGEIYNAPALQKELLGKGYTFRGHSDTEVMLAAFEEWGIQSSLERFLGMFAIALWDNKDQTLILIRDRLGKKPLYWGRQSNTLFFGSQLKSFYPHPAWNGKISKDALTAFFRFGYVPTPLSIYENIHKVEPGTMLMITKDLQVQKATYWSMEETCTRGRSAPFKGTFEEATEVLENLLKDAVQKRLLSDVPVGAFLSGGVDSSTVVALMQQQNSRKMQTFSIGFQEASYNEAIYAKEVAKHLGTDHHELYVSPQDAQAVIPNLSEWYDEPFADSSQIPTYLVSKLARNFVTVSLSGDGGDEVFGGYTRYVTGNRLWEKAQSAPWGLKKILAKTLEIIPFAFWGCLEASFLGQGCAAHLEEKILKASKLLRAHSLQDFYQILVSQWQNPDQLVKGRGQGQEFFPASWDILKDVTISPIEIMQFLDTMTYLPEDILAKVDRASMAVGLEARVPLIDHRVVEFAWTLPLEMKVHNGKGKLILREVLKRHVPEHLFERPKMGFGVPIGDWLREDLKDWAESLLSKEALEKSGLLHSQPILEAWDAHIKNEKNHQHALWTVLMFQSWYAAH